MTQETAPKALLLAFKSAAARPEYLADQKAPSNYGPEAASKYVSKAMEQAYSEASEIPVLATITEVLVTDENKNQLCRFQSNLTAQVARDLFIWFESNMPKTPMFFGTQYMYGFRLHTMMQIAGLECLAAHPDVEVPFHLWRSSNTIHDIYEYILPGDVRKKISLGGLCQFILGEPVDERLLYDNVEHQITIAHKLLKRVQLIEPPSPT